MSKDFLSFSKDGFEVESNVMRLGSGKQWHKGWKWGATALGQSGPLGCISPFSMIQRGGCYSVRANWIKLGAFFVASSLDLTQTLSIIQRGHNSVRAKWIKLGALFVASSLDLTKALSVIQRGHNSVRANWIKLGKVESNGIGPGWPLECSVCGLASGSY
eukprot:1150687-Pelagomonas_calceolata.AAC.7